MDEIRHVTVGVAIHPRTAEPDLGSLRAARQAAWVATRVGAQVTLLTAAWADDSSGPLELSPKALEELDMLRMRVAADGARVELEIVEEYPWTALIGRALRGEADLIVAGKRSGEVSGGRKVGSTAAKLLRKCPAPVWLVKPDHDLQHRHVLAATDFSSVSERAVAAASWIAGHAGGELHVLHAWNLAAAELRAGATMPPEEYEALVDERRAKAMGALEHEVRGLPVDPTLHLERGAAHTEILTELEEEHPDLLVMGSLSTGGRRGFQVGTIAERVLEQVDESILAFKPKDFVCPLAPCPDGEAS